jgi:tetratricopeptide (TPR) repeat protein
MAGQPAFSAINVEPEENGLDEEVDNTRQLQVDEALKLFQTALKLHAQGVDSYEDAAEAYNSLFKSDIFSLPEALTEFERAERQPDGLLALESAFATSLDAANIDPDGSGSSLPQALYLSHKNHGQFFLDGIKHRLRKAGREPTAVFKEPQVTEDACGALKGFNAALDRDPSDAELWRRTARVAAFLRSSRVSRYCLEAAIEVDDDPAIADVEPPSLAEGFAGEQLKAQLQVLSDDIALSHPVMAPFIKRDMAEILRRYLDPLPWLPNPTKVLAAKPSATGPVSNQLRISRPSASWTDLGNCLVQLVTETGLPGQPLLFDVPDIADEEVVQMEIDQQLEQTKAQANVDVKMSTEEDSLAKEATAESGNLSPNKAVPGSETAAQVTDEAVLPDATDADKDQIKEEMRSLPSRKRSQTAAGIADGADDENGDTKRSKRIRRRDTAVEEAVDPNTLFATQLQPYQAADLNLFKTTKNFLENIGVTDPVTLQPISEMLDSCSSEDRSVRFQSQAATDLRETLVAFDEETAKVLLNKRDSPTLGLSAFLEHTSSGSQLVSEKATLDETHGLKKFIKENNSNRFTIHDTAYHWIMAMSKTYMSFKWSTSLKTAVVQVISWLDEVIYQRVRYELDNESLTNHTTEEMDDLHKLVQALFELHLDIYERITNPNSVVEYTVRVATKGRLDRWQDIALEVARSPKYGSDHELSLRFMWASVFATSLGDGVSREYILDFWDQIRDFLLARQGLIISLPNNAIMPEISARAADREISKLTTMDFFLGLFQEDMGDPVSVIDTLEPVLNPESVIVAVNGARDQPAADGSETPSSSQKSSKKPIRDCASQGLRDLWKFLLGSSTDLRLFLWTRLGDAYGAIGYNTKHFSCCLRSIEVITDDLERELYLETPQEARKNLLLQLLKSLDENMIQALTLALNDNSAFDIVDEDHIRTTSSALAKLSCLLHVTAMFEDEVRIGMVQLPQGGNTLQSYLTKLREMQVRTWCLQYTVLKVGMSQHKSMFTSPENDLADYLAAVHQVLGLRKYCKASNKIFLKMMRVELLKQKNIENWEDYLGQVLYDLHGLKLGVGVWEVQEHGCPPEKLERKNALALVDKVTVLANRMPMKDLLKSDLKTAIEHMQQAIGQTKSTMQMIHNLRYFTDHLKRPIHPLRLYQAWKGSAGLDTVTAHTPDTALANSGWFFLLGMVALSKFKGVDLNRRQTPGATDDLRVGAQYLRLQLQLTPDHWEAWFRLAECFDYDLDEAVLWTAEKINKERPELVKLQRNAIHCYTLALSYSHSTTRELTDSESEALYDMYHNFAMRVYASSREPFAMEAFQHEELERFFIEALGTGTFKKILHGQMSAFRCWKYAAGLFKKAMAGRPKDWKYVI